MKIECLKENLINALSSAGRVAGKNLQLSVLNYVLLSTDKDNLKIKATNLDLGIEIDIPAKVEEKGVVAVPGTTLYNYVSNIQTDQSIKIEHKEGNISIYTPEAQSTINTHSAEDFPTIPRIEEENKVKIPVEDFIKGVKSVGYSASNSTIKPELSSVNIFGEGGKIYFVATDSFRLAEKVIPVKGVEDFNSILIPIKNIPEILRILELEEGEVEIEIGSNQVSFSTKRLYLTSRLVEGSFPDYKQIIPTEYITEVTVLKQDLVNAMKTTNVFLDKFNQVNFKIDPEDKKFSISAKNNDIGESTNFINASVSGEEVDINFNHKYVVDCFSFILSDSVTLFFSGVSKPMIIKGVSDESFMYLVMPMSK